MADKRMSWPSGLTLERPAHPAIEVENNEVVWVNENLKMPFDFEVGKPSSMALLLDFYAGAGGDRTLRLRTRARTHGRSADLGPIYFEDTQGRVYRDVDIKGPGNVEWSGEPAPWEDRPHHDRVEGLLNKKDALLDARMAELLTTAGVRTHRCISIIELKELPFPEPNTVEPTMVSVKQLKLERELPDDFVPVVQWRAFGTKTRLADVAGAMTEGTRKEVADAIALVKKETGGQVYDESSYVEWFSKTLGRNVARMHAAGYTHGYVTDHNITLDCRLTDFDSVEPIKRLRLEVMSEEESDDIEKGERSLARFMLTAALVEPARDAATDIEVQKTITWFHEAYNTERAKPTSFAEPVS